MTAPKKNPSRWKPGQSGNARGKPKGAKDRRTKWRDQLGDELDDVLRALLVAAKSGDIPAIALVLSRCCPPVRPQREPIAIVGADPEASLAHMGRQIVAAAARGDLASDAAAELLAGLASCARLVESTELIARVEALEKGNAP